MKTLSLGLLALLLLPSKALGQAPYFEGKTIRVLVGYPAGSAHDQWGRMVASQLPKYIPGNPNTIVENRPGAGSIVAANFVAQVAKSDGLTLAVVNAALYLDQMLKRPEVRFDWPKLTWVGSTTRTNALLYMWAAAPYRTIHDVRNAAIPPKCGATGTGNTGYYLPKLLERATGAKFTLVTGYQGGAEIEIGVERGEVQCRAFTVQVFFGREPFHTWRSKNLVRVLMQTGKKRDERLPDAPLLTELMDQYQTSDSTRRLATVLLGSGEFGSAPMIAPPGVPADVVKLLRAGYAKALASPELIADAKKRGFEAELISGEELGALAKEVLSQPAEVIASMKKVIGK